MIFKANIAHSRFPSRFRTLPRPHQRRGLIARASNNANGTDEESRLASLMIYCGGTGSLALIGAGIAGIEMFSRPFDDIGQIAETWLFIPILLLLDALILLPRPHGQGSAIVPGLLKDLDSSSLVDSIKSTATLYQIVVTGAGFTQGGVPYNLGKEIGFASLRDTTREMLQRGFGLHFLSNELQELGYQFNLEWLSGDGSAKIAGVLMTLALLPAVFSEARVARIFTARGVATVKLLRSTDEEEDDLIKEWRLVKEFEKAPESHQAKAAYFLTLFRGTARFASLNAVFVLSHFDLYYSILFAIVSDLLLLVHCKIGREQLPSIFNDKISHQK